MERLQYIIEDKTIAYLFGINNFLTEESAILELVKNAYDAGSISVTLGFINDSIIIEDDGIGMNSLDIKEKWMHVGISDKLYDIEDANYKKRVLAGSKGIGRFALARLGEKIVLYSKKENFKGVTWTTDWHSSILNEDNEKHEKGTKIVISELRDKWGKKKIQNLILFLSKTYNDASMKIVVKDSEDTYEVTSYFPFPVVGKNCLSTIEINYDSLAQKMWTTVYSDEFLDEAQNYCLNINLKNATFVNNLLDEIKLSDYDLTKDELELYLKNLGNFSAHFYFNIKPTKDDMEKFLYKYSSLPIAMPGGIILYRNAFSISAYEGRKDWLGLGNRARKSPAAASHPTGAWRVRENQISGKVEIDKKRNSYLIDISNRQGLEENIYYKLLIEIIHIGLAEFERYRQGIIRSINVKNVSTKVVSNTAIADLVVSNAKKISDLTKQEEIQLRDEIIAFQKDNKISNKEKRDTEERYKYDVRILNVLATVGLKASSIAHELENKRNLIATNTTNIISALKTYEVWDELNSPERTKHMYNNVPALLKSNKEISDTILAFMNVMLSETEKKQFIPVQQNVYEVLNNIKNSWETDYVWLAINIIADKRLVYFISEDIIQVILDNLILNSVQQNEDNNHLKIDIQVELNDNLLSFVYQDNGKGLDKKYLNNPRKILEVHETTRENGHGLGMWIVNNTIVMSGGSINDISSKNGFYIKFKIGGSI